MTFRSGDSFEKRHIGPYAADLQEMLSEVGARSLDSLMAEIVPAGIRNQVSLPLPVAESESEYLDRMSRIAERNLPCRSFIGLGYYGTITPSVILRNVLENPSWYTDIGMMAISALLQEQVILTAGAFLELTRIEDLMKRQLAMQSASTSTSLIMMQGLAEQISKMNKPS